MLVPTSNFSQVPYVYIRPPCQSRVLYSGMLLSQSQILDKILTAFNEAHSAGVSTMTLKTKKNVLRHSIIDIERPKIDCLSFVYVPATSAAHNRLLFFFLLLRPFTVLMKNTRAIKQSIFLRCLCHGQA